MARSRNIKPSFFTNEQLAELPFDARLLFIGLWTLADREGRLEDRPKRVKMSLFPADNVDPDKLLNMLAQEGFIVRYEKEGSKYIQVVNFRKHQNPHVNERPSTIPVPDGHRTNPADSLNSDSLCGASAPKVFSFWDIGESFGIQRPTMGRMVKEFGEEATSDAIRKLSLMNKRPAEATSYVWRMLKEKKAAVARKGKVAL